MIQDFSKLYRNLSYTFKDVSILNRALTHRSKTKKNYERLEFLGDSILGFVIAEVLYHKFPDDEEGKLSQVRSKLVRGATLAKLALELQIDEYIIFGDSEKNASHRREKILEDVVEAVIGAIYLDSNFETAKKIVLKWYSKSLSQEDFDIAVVKDNKSSLQEILLQQSLSLPVYDIVSIDGKDHEQVFNVSVSCQEHDLSVTAQGKSRKKAEQVAAGKMIQIIKDKVIDEKE
ncbi:ribonuclease III [Francisella adeliensis]|uniref:Ribonuclease 3 n=1 Tax=Francisella adeliensis TaxID=2007306 RepID=A0A2Z4XZU0_9GAMM|nr:ribonuclease III [Francisella adeliensis]AXA34401.1 ribonuclease III [Francisella adeliensis]MBK2086493.1 ribonuclease III [Francisella adeliensis]MBK2096121.1 ribonuclease III [Francisella adeliensis]QIW12647.1 ribonuclease III [Francisella adeliensis]QIW14522.1 ribonuclease III [Francisella adeliensis]